MMVSSKAKCVWINKDEYVENSRHGGRGRIRNLRRRSNGDDLKEGSLHCSKRPVNGKVIKIGAAC